MNYHEFLAQKRIDDEPSGLAEIPKINDTLFPFQRDIVRWALRRGRSAVFADCGLGKTPIQLEWAKHVPGRVVVVAPLAVAQQTVHEGEKFNVQCAYCRADSGDNRIVVTNYEMLDKFNPDDFTGIVLDESSILKSYTGKFRTKLINEWGRVPFRLAATATPAPNDYMELGNHSEFLGVLTRQQMLSMFFVHDGGEVQKWRLKGHAESQFWRWMASWAVMVRKPSDLGYDDGAFTLPPCHIHHEIVADNECADEGLLFPLEAQTLSERLNVRRATVEARCDAASRLINGSTEPWVAWCNLNSESDMLARLIPDAIEVRGSQSIEEKESALAAFSSGQCRVIVTKPTIAGFGLNWQHCPNMVFVGLSDSYEQFYQAIRRCWRFGQTRPVHAYVVTADTEGAVVANIKRKEADAAAMADNMVFHMKDLQSLSVHNMTKNKGIPYAMFARDKIKLPAFIDRKGISND